VGVFLFTAFRTALGPTQPPIQWVPEAFSLGVKLTTHLHVLPSWRGAQLSHQIFASYLLPFPYSLILSISFSHAFSF